MNDYSYMLLLNPTALRSASNALANGLRLLILCVSGVARIGHAGSCKPQIAFAQATKLRDWIAVVLFADEENVYKKNR